MPALLNGVQAGESYDPHLEKMKIYPEVPMWWYIMLFVGSFCMAMATLYTGHSGLPWSKAQYFGKMVFDRLTKSF